MDFFHSFLIYNLTPDKSYTLYVTVLCVDGLSHSCVTLKILTLLSILTVAKTYSTDRKNEKLQDNYKTRPRFVIRLYVPSFFSFPLINF